MLPTLSFIYDPLGLSTPFLHIKKNIIQTLGAQRLSWGDQVLQDIGSNWKNGPTN